MPDRAVVIANPAARLVETHVSIERITECLQQSGLQVEVHLTEQAGDGQRLAAEAVQAGVKRVVAAGGDGTINEVIQSLAGTSTELAIVPLGTGNVFARSIGLDERHLADSCQIAAGGQVRTIDLGLMGGRYFAATAGAGIDAQVALNLDPGWKQRIGKVAFVPELLRTILIEDPHVLRLTMDGRTIEGPMWGVLICNTNEYTWRIHPVPDSREDDGLLDVVVLHRHGFLDFLDLVGRMFFSGETAVGHPTASIMRVGHMEMEATPPMPWQVEGEPLGMTPVAVQVMPGALRLVTAPPPA